MRFCPFCSAENADELAVCQSCGRRLPPLPPRRARNAPPTGVQLPPRPGVTTQAPPLPMRRAGATVPPAATPTQLGQPPIVAPMHTQIGTPVVAQPGPTSTLVGPPPVVASGDPGGPPPSSAPTSRPAMLPPALLATTVGFAPIVPSGSGLRAPAPVAPGSPRETIPGVPMPPPLASDDARALANALSPGPAAQRREAAPAEPGDLAGNARRRSDTLSPPGPSGPRTIPSVTTAGAALAPSGPRPAPTTNPPPVGTAPSDSRRAPTTNPPPVGTAPSGPRSAPTTSPPPVGTAPSGPRSAPATSPPPVGTAPSGPRPAPTTNPPPLGAATAAAPATNPPFAARTDLAPDPAWATGYPRAPVGYIDPDLHASALAVDANRRRAEQIEPPPTRIHRAEALVDRPFTPPTVSQVPEIPEPGLVSSARYAVRFAQARWQRRGAIKVLGADIKKDTDALDQVLGALGGVARTAKVSGRVFAGENAAITAAEDHAAQMSREHNDVDTRKLEENSRFVEVERERNTKLGEAEHAVDEAQKELAQLEAQRRGLRDSRKELERRQKAYLKAAEDSEKQAGASEAAEPRQDLRRAAEQHRREAAAIEPERQEADRGLAAIERPIAEGTAKLDAAKAELDAAKRSLADAREGHTHRLAELDAEQKRKAREIAGAEAEIARRLVTLGTLVNLNRIDDPQFAELYQRIDRLRGAITARTTEIEKLTAEREAYDRGHLVRGVSVIGGAILLFIALIVILRALLVR